MSEPRKRSVSILFVEDDPLVSRAVERQLRESCGCVVEVASTAASAKEAMLRDGHDRWIIDQGLPDGSGLELIRWARARRIERHALVVTGIDDQRIARDSQAMGLAFVPKPIGIANLRAFLAQPDPRLQIPAQVARLAAQHELTMPEHDVLAAYVSGVPRSALATTLGVAESTIVGHVEHLLRKIGAESLDDVREQLAREVSFLLPAWVDGASPDARSSGVRRSTEDDDTVRLRARRN